jgi:hypothetical protein
MTTQTGEVTIADIKVWAIDKGISHIVAAQVPLGTFTACGTVFAGDWRRKRRTKRICEKCRERLKDATLEKGGTNGKA